MDDGEKAVNDLHVLVVNIDNLTYTKDCMADLMRQIDHDFDITVVDNGSIEIWTADYLNVLEANGIRVVRHKNQVSLNGIWNQFYKDTKNKYLCYLNNDTRVCCNYTSSIKEVFEKEPSVGVVCHATNNPKYAEVKELEYIKLFKRARQGWDFTIRREAYSPIPDQLHTYCGDDYLYAKLYENNYSAAMILSSPVIHFLGMSQKSTSGERFASDVAEFDKLGLPTFEWSGYSIDKPYNLSYGMIKNNMPAIITINVVTHERYEDFKIIMSMLLAQTDPRFIIDVWQDGKDDKKREIAESFHDNRIIYNENRHRHNTYGHDMRGKSILNCKTPLWCTTNDDNWISPQFVEKVVCGYENYDIIKIAVAMENLPNYPLLKNPFTEKMIREGVCDVGEYSKHMMVLDPKDDTLGKVDACSYIVKAEIAKYYGWKNMEFHGDFLVYENFRNAAKNIKRINEVLQVHR